MTEQLAIDALDHPACMLGESALWDPDTETLYWVDILGQEIHAHRWGKRETVSVLTPSEVGCVALRADGGLVAALRHQTAFCDTDAGVVLPLVDVEADRPANRFNDGAVDPGGRFWFGSMDLEEQAPTGALYCMRGDGTVTRVVDGIVCSNGPTWSPDGATMYHVDSARRLITAYEFDVATGDLGESWIFVDDRDATWFPDGVTVDAEGFVWNCKWDGGAVVRYAPDGTIDRIIELPVPRPTRCAFVGSGMDQLAVTSARWGLSNVALTQSPLSGRVLLLDPGVNGLAAHRYAG